MVEEVRPTWLPQAVNRFWKCTPAPQRRVFYWEIALKLSDADWGAIKDAYETSTMRVMEICKAYDVPPTTLYARARKHKWAKRYDLKHRPTATGLRERLAVILDLKLSALEQDLAGAKASDLTAIGNLLKQLDRVEEDDTTQASHTLSPQEVTVLRQRILDHIETLRRDAG